MSLRLIALISTVAGLLSLSVPSHGHHGTAVVYDLTQSITISGTVTEFRFVNPHTLIYLDVRGEDGKVVNWMGGLSNQTRLARTEGWTRETLKPGDVISVTGAPARGNAPSVWVQQVVRDGKSLLEGEYTG